MRDDTVSAVDQRQWRKETQRSVRLALIGVKDARRKFVETSMAGYQEATELGNNLLLQQYLRNMQLGVLKGVPGIRQASADKLAGQNRRHSEKLHSTLRILDGAVQSLHASLKDLKLKDQSKDWQNILPVFNTMTVHQIIASLQHMAHMYDEELSVKRTIVQELDSASEQLSTGKQLDLQALVTKYLSTWVSNPKVQEEAIEQKLAILAEDMSGY